MARLTLASLLIKLGLDQREYREEMQKARKRAKSTSRQIERDLHRVQGGFDKVARGAMLMGSAIGLVAGGGGLGLLINRAATTQDELQKTAIKLGANRKELVALRLAAERYSSFTEQTFDTALQRQTRRVAEAAKGMGEAQDALAELGLDAEALAAMRPDQQFTLIAKAMAQIPDQGARVRLAFKLFDTEGVALVNTLMAGADGFGDIAQEASDFGLILSDIDAETLVRARQEIDRMGDALEGAGNRLAVALAPATTVLAGFFTDMIKDAGEAEDSVDDVSLAVLNLAGLVVDAALAIKADLQRAFAAGQIVESYIDLWVLGAEKVGLVAEGTAKSFDQISAEAGQAWDDLVEGQAELEARLMGEKSAVEELTARYRELIAARNPANDNAPGVAGGPVPEGAGGIQPPGVPHPRPDVGDDSGEQQGPTEQEAAEQERRLEQQRGFVEQMLGLERGMIDEMIRITEMGADAREGITVDSALTMGKALAQAGQSIFKNNKAFAIAEAIINTHQGITKALASAPPPISYALAAAVAAKGFASVRAISSSRKGSRAGGHYSGGHGGFGGRDFTPRDPQPAAGDRANVRGPQRLIIDLPQVDRSITQEELRQILAGIGGLIDDDYSLEVRGTSSLTGAAA